MLSFLSIPLGRAQEATQVTGISYARQNVILKYVPTENRERFVFDFPPESKISYSIQNSSETTTITFSRLFRLDTLNLSDYPNYANIMQKKLPSRKLQVIFPLSLASTIEHLNSVILDFYPSGVHQSNTPEKKVKPLQISSLSFPWSTPAALSVFKRGKYLWIVFNQHRPIDIKELEKSAGNMVKDIIQLPHTAATILRLEAADELYSEVRKEGLLWIVDLYNQKTNRKIRSVQITTDTTLPNKPYLQVDLPRTEDIFSFLDPDVGDMLMAITSSEPGYAFLTGYKYPDFEFLPTSQGVAINSDDFGIGIVRNASGFMLQTTQHPLNLSKNLDILKSRANAEADFSAIDISQELTVPIIRKTFAASEKFLKIQVEIAPEADKNKFNIELARFYLSHGLGTNAFGVLRNVEENYKANNTPLPPRLLGLKATALFLMKRYDQAFDIFSQPVFARNPEIALWKALADTDENRDQSMEALKNVHFIQGYPSSVKKGLLLRGISYAIEKKNEALTQKILDFMKASVTDPEIEAAYNYYEAEKIRLQGYFRSALPQYKIAAMSSVPSISALARFRLADFNSRLPEIKQTRTIQEFERLKFAWGEKNFKINVLNKLTTLYLQSTDYYRALKTLDIISQLSSQQKPTIEQHMIQIMEEIYYYNNDNNFDPIKALALFDDYGYLTERSPHQTAIIIKLADRLVAVDLLDRAYALLDNYLSLHRNMMSEQEISAMGSRLALINMFRHNEEAALHNLFDTAYDNISETLRLQRKIIEAQAYTRLGSPEKALALLKDNTSRNAILLKSEIYWNAGQWDKASDMIRYLVEKPKPNTPLSEEQIRYVLDWLTALKQAGKETVIVRVRNSFLPYFEKTPYISIFNILTDFLEDDKISIKDINHTIQNVQAFSDFAKQYTKSLLTENLAESNVAPSE